MGNLKKRKDQAKAVCDELDTFNEFFATLLKRHVFDAFVQKLKECRQSSEENQEQGVVLLKLCGSLIDVRFMLETVCETLGLKCVFIEEHTNPIDLLNNVIESEELHLVYIQDNVSLKYLNRLLETFRSSTKPVSLIVTMRSNDSNVIRLDPSLAASVPVESFVFSDPEPLFDRFVNELVLNYTRETGLILSGPLLEQMRTSFHEEKQSFVELQNLVGMSLAKFGMRKHLGEKTSRIQQVVPQFEKYWLLLELFTKYLERESASDDIFRSTLEVHIKIQSDEDWRSNAFERANSYWRNAEKNTWLRFMDSCLDFAQKFQDNCCEDTEAASVVTELEEIKEKINQTKFESMAEQIARNMGVSPSRRKTTTSSQQTRKIIEAMDQLFSPLQPFSEYCISKVQPFESCQDENMDDSKLPDFVKSSPCF